MRFTTTIVGAVLLITVGSFARAAGERDRNDCGMSNPSGKTDSHVSVIQADGEDVRNRDLAYRAVLPANVPERDRAAADCIEMIRLDPSGSRNYRNRSVQHPARTDLERAVARYSKSIMLDPKNDYAFFRRGIANLYAGSLAKALADISKASQLDPKYAYYLLWLDIIAKRGNLPSHLAQSTAQINMTKWPAPIVRLFLGHMTPAAVLAAAANDPDSNVREIQVCEANFYIGEWALRQAATEEAARLFRLAAADCPREFVEGPAAYAELRALGASLKSD
jgi:lipoprotein NlpI